MDGTSRRHLLTAAAATATTVLAGCLGGDTGAGDQPAAGDTEPTVDGETTSGGTTTASTSWREVELRTVRDGESFTIEGLDGPVVIQSFAVWCPKCWRQSETLEDLGDSVTVVGLNTDPNEDATKVRTHAEENGFDWRFAVAPTTVTGMLVDEFGSAVVNAPSTPIIVACEGGGSEFMAGTHTSIGEIEAAVGRC